MDIDDGEEEDVNEDGIDSVPEEDAGDLDNDAMMVEDGDDEDDDNAEVDEEEYQQLLEEAEADQSRKIVKGSNNKAADSEAISDLPIEEDPNAHFLLKRLLRFETAFIHHHAELRVTELNASQQQTLQLLKQFAQAKIDSKPHLAKEDEAIAQSIQDNSLRRDDITLSVEEGLIQLEPAGLGQRIMDYLQQDDNAILLQWLKCNRACFILNELFQQPLFFEQMLRILGGVDEDVLDSALQGTEGGKVLAKLRDTRLQLEADREAALSSGKRNTKKQTPAKAGKKGKGSK